MFHEILLMVLFGGVKFSSRGYLCCDRAVELAGFIPPGFYSLGGLLLSLALVKNGRAVLRAHVVVLAVERGGIVHAKEVIQEGFIG